MRVTTAFNRLLALPGARVTDVSFTEDGVVCEVALRRRRAACSSCGQVCRSIHDRSPRRWRHLDLAGQRLQIEYALRRVRCTDCGVHVEAVPWARPRARHTRDFEDLTAFLAQQLAKTPIARLLRVRWDTVGRIVVRVVADHLDARRLEGLLQIGVDEIAYRRGQRYLTTVADHRSGAIIWMRPGRNAQTLQAFFTELGERKRSIRAVSIDMSAGYEKAVRAAVPQAQVCIDPFHVCQLAARSTRSAARSGTPGASRRRPGASGSRACAGRCSRRPSASRSPSSPRSARSRSPTAASSGVPAQKLRLLYHLDDPGLAPEHLAAWLRWASRSKLKPFVKLARTVRRHREGILAAIRLGLSNGRLEGLNSRVRLISHRGFGFHGAPPLIALVYLCCGGVTVAPPLA